MPILRNAFFIRSFLAPSEGPKPTANILVTTPGIEGVEADQTIPSALPGLQFDASAALTYSTVFETSGLLYATDPATGTPFLVAEPGSPGPTEMVSLGSSAVFSAVDTQSQSHLWTTDGTASGTRALAPAGANLNLQPRNLIGFGNLALFIGNLPDDPRGAPNTRAPALWRTDGTSSGTTEITALSTDIQTLDPIGVVNGRLIFRETFSVYGHVSTFYSTDGTTAGTRAIGPDYNFGFPTGRGVQLPNGSLLAAASDLVSFDGVGGSTVIAAPPGVVANVTALGQGAAFTVTNDVTTRLWVTDGTTAGTRQVNTAQVKVGHLTAFGSRVLFSAQDQTGTSTGLWVSDGTDAGTVEIKAGINPSSIVVDGTRAFVNGSDDPSSSGYFSLAGAQYTTDGTAAGTRRFSQLVGEPGSVGISPGIVDTTHAIVTGTHNQYEVAASPTGALAIADTVANRDGSASYGAHTIEFTDGTGVLDTTGNAEAVTRLYQAALGRTPDIGGLIAFTERLDAGTLTLIQAADIMVASAEFIVVNGTPTDAAFVRDLYENDYHRAPDAAGLSAFTGALSAGFSRGAALVTVAQSYESRIANIGAAGQANDATVYRLYQAVADRAPDPNGQQAFSAALANGLTAEQLATDLLGSGEYAGKFGAPSNGQFVTELYQNILHRAVDPSGLASFSAELSAGISRATVAATIAGGTEARLDTALATHDAWVSLTPAHHGGM